MEIQRESVDAADVQQLIREHLDDMRGESPPESVHALDGAGLRDPAVEFFTLRSSDGVLLSIGALKTIGTRSVELKSMRTARAARGHGYAGVMLTHLVALARERGHSEVVLETGTTPFFDAARRLYARHGFEVTGPFANYVADSFSMFMRLAIPATEPGQPPALLP